MKMRNIAVLLSATLLAGPALAASCAVEIDADDAMKFNMSNIDASKSCKELTVTLKHVGKLPKNAMGHNWVLSKTADAPGIATDGIPAGLDKNYLKPDDARVIAHTKVVGGGESDTVTVDMSKLAAGESYTWFCSFPGHSSVMKGTLTLVD